MQRTIAIIQGHPDPAAERFTRALQAAYMEGARAGGHEVRVIDVATLDFPLVRTKDEWENGEPPPPIMGAQAIIHWADHLVIIYPLWAGSMPALLKAFFEQAFRPRFAFGDTRKMKERKLRGRSARIVITMGMPAFVYRWFFGAHSLKSLERNILGFCGIGPIKVSLVGSIDDPDPAKRRKWLEKMKAYGTAADAGYL
ncbi:MAG TPA: NAD(P)H-dependent oxidoreductase [Usitatibacter sp.]|nr:NAD(P)H-dependent oxidoreductase [Usitatibacter sp.]